MSSRKRAACAIAALACASAFAPLPSLADGVQVVDANDLVVGPYEAGAVFVTEGGRTTAILLQVNHHNPAWLIYKEAAFLYFANADCTGTAYIATAYVIPGTVPAVVQHRADGEYEFIADSRKLATNVTSQAFTNAGGQCEVEQFVMSKAYPSTSPPVKLPFVEPFAVN